MSTVDIKDTCSGIALLYGQSDEYTLRLQAAMETNDLDEMEHVTALMVSQLYGREDPDARLAGLKWAEAFGKTT